MTQLANIAIIEAFDAHISGESTAELRRNTRGMMVGLTGLPSTPAS